MVQGHVCLNTPETFYEHLLVVVPKQTQDCGNICLVGYQNTVLHFKVHCSLLLYEINKFS